MKIDSKFIKEYGRLIRSRLRANGVKSYELDDYESLVYTRLLSHFSYDEKRGPFTTWLGWVVRSVVSNERKKEGNSTDALDHASDLSAAVNVIGDEDAGTAMDELARVFKASDLSERDKRLVKDIHIEGYTYKEAAERFGMSLEAVSKVVSRAMAALRSVAEQP